MEYFNLFGMVFVLVLLIPNAIYAIISKGRIQTKERHRILEPIETVGRIGCMAFMVINIPGTVFGYRSDEAFAIYLMAGFALSLVYCALWAVFWRQKTLAKALCLSILPSLLFLFCGVMNRSILLIVSTLIFAPAHILISCKDVLGQAQDDSTNAKTNR